MEIGTQIKALRLRKGVTLEAMELIEKDCYDVMVVYNGNYDGTMHKFGTESEEAIAALNEEIEVAARDWSITEGEFVDKIRREIARLERARQ